MTLANRFSLGFLIDEKEIEELPYQVTVKETLSNACQMLNPVSINASGSYYYGELQRAENGAGEHLEASAKTLRRAKPEETGQG